MAVIGVDVGGTKLALARFSEAGEVLQRAVAPLEGRRGGEVGELIVRQLHRLLEDEDFTHDPVNAVGAIVPGIYWAERGCVWAPNIPGWDDYPLLDELHEALGSRLSVAIDSDRAGYILGDTWQGTARGCRNAVFLAVGTGIGAGS